MGAVPTGVLTGPPEAEAGPPKAEGPLPWPLVAAAEDAGPLAIAGQADARERVTSLTPLAAGLACADAKVGRYPPSVRLRPPLAAAAFVKVPVPVWPRLTLAAAAALLVLEEVVITGVVGGLVALTYRERKRARQGRPLAMATAPLDDQEASELGPALLAADGAPPKVILGVGRPTAKPRPEPPSKLCAPPINVGHAGRSLRRLEGPPEETVGAEAQAPREEEITDGVELAVEAGDSPLNVPLAAATHPIALLLTPPTGRALPLARCAAVLAPAMPPAREVPVEQPPRVGLVI